MRIVEVVAPTNADKTILGSREIKLELDTETGELTLDTPAMFGNPVVNFEDLKDAMDKLDAVRDQVDAPPEPG